YGDIPDIYGYPARLNQVFLNLLTNAIQSIRIPVRSPSGPRRMINGSPRRQLIPVQGLPLIS
ncbi:MAG: hypothetical protein VX603_18940, partial [Gemmatimonadota bacterium]|nr:hypothetical protein [Gemmatimonadota bacterium]MEE2995235.1 hypothetical protein [Gemmatimonadota bacterium]